MLEALLDDDGNDVLDDDDRGMVEKFIVSIGNRLGVLKRKLESTAT
jgi:serine/threonine-protein kinase ULK/ATG1